MLNYGGYAQSYFKYDDTPLANVDLTEEEQNVESVTLDMLEDYGYVIDGEEEGIHYYGSSLILKSETTIRHYFYLDEGYEINNYEFKLADKTLTPTSYGSYYYVEIPNLASGELSTSYVVTVGDFSISYSGMSYVKKMLESENLDTVLGNLMKAIYLYSQAANTYFNVG